MISGISVRTTRRVAAELAVTTVDNDAECARRQIGRPSKADAYRDVVVHARTEDATLRSVEVWHRARQAGSLLQEATISSVLSCHVRRSRSAFNSSSGSLLTRWRATSIWRPVAGPTAFDACAAATAGRFSCASGGVVGEVEIDDTWIGGPQPGLRGGRQLKGRKAAIALVAVERRKERSGRVRMAVVPDFKQTTMVEFVKQQEPATPAARRRCMTWCGRCPQQVTPLVHVTLIEAQQTPVP